MTNNITGFEPAQYRHTPVKKIKFYDPQLCQFCTRTDTHLIVERKKKSFHFLPDLFILKEVVQFPTNNMPYPGMGLKNFPVTWKVIEGGYHNQYI